MVYQENIICRIPLEFKNCIEDFSHSLKSAQFYHFWKSVSQSLSLTLNPLILKSDQHLISPYNNTAKPFIKIMSIKEMIANLRSFDL